MTDEDLRPLLLAAAPAAPAGDPVHAVRRRLRRRRLVRACTAAGASVGCAVGAAALFIPLGPAHRPDTLVAASPTAQAAPSAVVPFVRRPYPPFGTGTRPAPTKADCAGSALTTEAMTDAGQPMTTGGTALTVRLSNASSSACQVPLRGKVTIRDPAGAVVASGYLGSGIDGGTSVQPAVPPGGRAVLTGGWLDGCGLPEARPLSVSVEFQRDPGGETTTVADELPKDAPVPTCRPRDKIVYADGPVSLDALVVLDEQGRRVDDPTMSLQAELVDVPAEVLQGQALSFGVRLHNPTAGPIGFTYENCPLYAATLNRNNGAATPIIDGAMNCEDVREPVPSGGSIVFQMRFDVPAERFGPGVWDLSWTRTDAGTAPLQAQVVVTAPSER